MSWIAKKNSENNTKFELFESDNSTEHLFECKNLRRLIPDVMKAFNLESVDNM